MVIPKGQRHRDRQQIPTDGSLPQNLEVLLLDLRSFRHRYLFLAILGFGTTLAAAAAFFASSVLT
jgi:hypothetical protein